jgi:hypothetical protein
MIVSFDIRTNLNVMNDDSVVEEMGLLPVRDVFHGSLVNAHFVESATSIFFNPIEMSISANDTRQFRTCWAVATATLRIVSVMHKAVCFPARDIFQRLFE